MPAGRSPAGALLAPEAVYWSSSVNGSAQCVGEQGCWPRYYILGAQKAMTTTIFQMLKIAGLVCRANVNASRLTWDLGDEKEAHFFTARGTDWDTAASDPGLVRSPHFRTLACESSCACAARQYTRLYQEADCPSRRFIDATARYLDNYDVPKRFVALVPPAWQEQQRFVALLREPIRRDLSWFNHRADEGWDDKFCSPLTSSWVKAGGYNASSEEAAREVYAEEVDCALDLFTRCMAETAGSSAGAASHQPGADEVLQLHSRASAEMQSHKAWYGCMESEHKGRSSELVPGMYAMHLLRWRTFVPRKQLLVLQSEAFATEPRKQLIALTGFLGLPSGSAAGLELRHDNAHVGLKYPRCATVQKLAAVFKPYNEMLLRDLDADRSSGAAPPRERPFAPWPVAECTTEQAGDFDFGGVMHDPAMTRTEELDKMPSPLDKMPSPSPSPRPGPAPSPEAVMHDPTTTQHHQQ